MGVVSFERVLPDLCFFQMADMAVCHVFIYVFCMVVAVVVVVVMVMAVVW